MKSKLQRILPPSVQAWLRNRLESGSKEWRPGPCIESQLIRFRHLDRTLEVEADFTTPLYETVAELVDFDSYQLQQLPWAEAAGAWVLDIGANIGVAALLLASRPGVRVVCYEPMPANADRLRENLARNRLSGVTVHEAAVSDADGEAAFRTHATASVAGRLAEAGTGPDIIPVRTVSLRRAVAECDGEIFLIKMDCEGGEYSIMRQFTAELAARVRHVTFEVHDLDAHRNVRAIRAQLESLGYRVSYKPDFLGRPNLHHLLGARADA